ncbi:MAG TPA: hypothetical protein PK562_02545 [Candidatus Omnitrophota bacterium]|nr:hypothetical protein [Candidatus Omnitrophota bacterium]
MSEDRISVVQRCLIGAFVVLCVVLCDSAGAQDRPKEKIVFSISTGGYAEYNDLGIIDRNGKKVKLVTFRTHIGGLMDGFERIYGEPDTFLPVRIERNVVFALRKEYLVEDYSPATSSVSIKKYVRDKFLAEYRITRDRPFRTRYSCGLTSGRSRICMSDGASI